eukprot:gene760-803_t
MVSGQLSWQEAWNSNCFVEDSDEADLDLCLADQPEIFSPSKENFSAMDTEPPPEEGLEIEHEAQLEHEAVMAAEQEAREQSEQLEDQVPGAKNRIKVYDLNDEGQWNDMGTGYVEIGPFPVDETSRIIVRKEVEEGAGDPGPDGEAMLDCPILQPEGGVPPYQKQGETIICWSEPDNGADRALSFQDNDFAAEIWALMQENNLAPQEDLFDDSPTSSVAHSVRDHGVTSFLELPTIDNLDMIWHALQRVAMTGRERIAAEVGNADWLGTLLSTFEKCEIDYNKAMEDYDKAVKSGDASGQEEEKDEMNKNAISLQCLFNIVRCLFTLSNHHLTETLLSDEMYLWIFGILEHDPEIEPDRRLPHRKYLQEKAKFNDVIAFNNDLVTRKIHINFRLTYLKDVAMPRSLDDAAFSQIVGMMMHNSMMMLESFLADGSRVLDDLFSIVGKQFPALQFLHQLLTLSKTMPPAGNERARLYEEIERRSKFFTELVPWLTKHQPGEDHPEHLQIHKERSVAMDILLMSVGQQVGMLRRHIIGEDLSLRGSKDEEKTDPVFSVEGIQAPPGARGHGSPFFCTLMRLICNETNISVQSQAAEVVRHAIDANTFEGSGVNRDDLLNVFYEQGPVEILAEPLRDNLGPDAPDHAFYTRQLICDLISFCVENHSYRMKFFILRQNIAAKISKLTSSSQKYVAVAAVRCLKTIVASRDEFYHRALSQRNAFKVPLEVFEENLPFSDAMRNMNLLASTMDDLLDFIAREDCKILVNYLCTMHESTLQRLQERLPSCRELLRKFAENTAPSLGDYSALGAGSLAPGPSSGFSTGLQNVRGSRGRQRSPGRDDDDVDDSYFDEDDDDDDETNQLTGNALGSLMLSYGDADDDAPESSSGGGSGKFSASGEEGDKSPEVTADGMRKFKEYYPDLAESVALFALDDRPKHTPVAKKQQSRCSVRMAKHIPRMHHRGGHEHFANRTTTTISTFGFMPDASGLREAVQRNART